MALITCPECGNQVSDQAKSCPRCGHPFNKTTETVYEQPIIVKKGGLGFWGVVFAIIVAILIMSLC